MYMTGGILSGEAIADAVSDGSITIDPFNREQINPVSYDLTLGRGVTTYEFGHVHDVEKEPVVNRTVIDRTFGIVLRPGVGYLMHTVERVCTEKYVPVIDGKSSIGRLFVSVHCCAGYGDPGYDGQWTLEVTTVYPMRLYAGMRIAQMRFHSIIGEIKLYGGNYQRESSRGAVPSRAWKMFRK